jgi:hypothetical protein
METAKKEEYTEIKKTDFLLFLKLDLMHVQDKLASNEELFV